MFRRVLIAIAIVAASCAAPPVQPGEPTWAGEQALDFYAGGGSPQVHCQLKAYVSIDLGLQTAVVFTRIANVTTDLPCGLAWGPTLLTATCTIYGSGSHRLACGGPQGLPADKISNQIVWRFTRVPQAARITIEFDSVIAGHFVSAVGNSPLIQCDKEVCRFQKI